ncbi:MAG TPA: HTH domain-containing protein [Acidimicrobiales bacterium]|nr:HTH domain-containing protein [Acidimicrobiales bacterium]
MVVERGGLGHGIRAEIARELGVSRSTISRDITATICAPREPRPKALHPTAAELIAVLGPLGERLAAQDCECGPQHLEEPRHALGHVLKFAAETLDAVEEGKLDLPPEDVRLLEGLRDRIVALRRQ